VAGGQPAGRPLADLALACGYYDQAHLAREFRALAGCPPTQWLAEEFRNVQAVAAGDAFGFAETVVYGDGDQVQHAELAWPSGGGVMLGSSRGDGGEPALRPGVFHAYVVTDDPDGLFARAAGAGAKVVQELTDKDYGSRDFAVLDPEGNHWSFGTYRGHPR
jgi:uncharacterized glyoxalase superfamily protein PhnB